ncbi:DUF1523 family protein [Thorsellia kenyensis]|uniref:DUF1523 family protein n=1 Tax=Thorsellia kenyensis TaxID=1549888 RepID=A0ABV6CAZ9_9GAMM
MLLKRIVYSIVALLAIVSFIWLDYYLPSRELVKIVGTEVKRVDGDGVITTNNPANGQIRDVYYISANRNWQNEDGKIQERVFRNEDTGWGFPFYFKFNSADVQARAKAFEQSQELALVTTYGWRMNMFSMFPNIVSITQATADTNTYSIRRYLGIGAWASAFIFITVWLRKKFKKAEKE